MQEVRRKVWRIERRPTPRLVKVERMVHSSMDLRKPGDVLVSNAEVFTRSLTLACQCLLLVPPLVVIFEGPKRGP